MQINVKTDSNIDGSKEFEQKIRAEIEHTLRRFGEQLTRVEVHLSDESSSSKSAGRDKRCVMEARLSGLQPIAVTDDADFVDAAISGAAEKLKTALDRTLGKLRNVKGRTSYGGDRVI